MLPLLADHNVNVAVVRGIRRNALEAGLTIDLVTAEEVGVAAASDPDLLEWAAAHGRVVFSGDVNTLIGFASVRVEAGLKMPGLLAIFYDVSLARVIDDLLVIAAAGEPGDYDDQIAFLPI